MSVKTLISVEEYLRTSFPGTEPDYVDAEFEQRSIPHCAHSRIPMRLVLALPVWQDRGQLFCFTEIRLRIGPSRFRVADFAAFIREQEPIPQDAALVIVEIVSPEDRHENLMIKLADYEEAGVEFLFVADPPLRKLSRYLKGDLLSVAALEIPVYGISIPLSRIFA